MKINKLIDTVNRAYIPSDYLRAPDIYYYMDRTIDDINSELQATYPTFTDWYEFVEEWNKVNPDEPKDRTVYDVIPDKYLRTVVALGTAMYYYASDEEGEQVAIDYQQKYHLALFKMVRDYHMLVPEEFQDNEGGYIDFSYNRERGPRDLHPRGVVMNGYNTRIL